MKKIFCVVMMLMATSRLLPQQWAWAKDIGRYYALAPGTGVKTNAAGDVFAFGTFQGIAKLGGATYYSDTTDYDKRGNYIARFNSAGGWIWSHMIAGTNTVMYDVSIDKQNNCYVAGYYANDLVLEDTTINGSQGIYLIAYSPEGHRKWIRIYDELAGSAALVNDANNNLIFAHGAFNGKIHVKRLFPQDGNEIWTRTYDAQGIVVGLRMDPDEKICVAGSFEANKFTIDNVTYFDETGTTQGSFLTRISLSTGLIENVEIIPGAMLSDFEFDAQGNMYVSGSYIQKMRVGLIEFTVKECDQFNCSEYFIAKLNKAGAAVWAKKRDDDIFQGKLDVSDSGDIYYTGSFRDTVSFNGITLKEDENRYGIFIFKFNTNGIAQWGFKDAGQYLTNTFMLDIAYSESKAAYLCGHFHNFEGRTWYGTDTMGYTHFYDNIVLAKLVDNFAPVSVFEQDLEPSLISVSPNPSSGTFNLSLHNQMKEADVRVFDMLGNCTFSRRIGSKQQNSIIDLGEHAKGIYLLEVRYMNSQFVKKIVVE